METKKTLILGASPNPARYSYLAAQRLKSKGHPVVLVGNRDGTVAEETIEKTPIEVEDLDTLTLYLSPPRQAAYYDYIIGLQPKRIIFNPGTENPELVALAQDAGIETEEACTLVLLSTDQY